MKVLILRERANIRQLIHMQIQPEVYLKRKVHRINLFCFSGIPMDSALEFPATILCIRYHDWVWMHSREWERAWKSWVTGKAMIPECQFAHNLGWSVLPRYILFLCVSHHQDMIIVYFHDDSGIIVASLSMWERLWNALYLCLFCKRVKVTVISTVRLSSNIESEWGWSTLKWHL